MIPKNVLVFRIAIIRCSGCSLHLHNLKILNLSRNYSCVAKSLLTYSGFQIQQFDFNAKRGVRTFPKDLHENKEEKRGRKHGSKNEAKQEQSENEKEDLVAKQFAKTFYSIKGPLPGEAKRIRIAIISTFLASVILTYWLFTRPEVMQVYNPKNPIDMEEFLQVYLPSGEVKKLIYVTNQNQVIAILHPGAVIRGKPIENHFVVVQCRANETVASFTRDIRVQEEALGIHPSRGIMIAEQEVLTTANYLLLLPVMLLIGYGSARLTLNFLKHLLQKKPPGGLQKKK